ncbi:MAG: molybdopterin-guanine dinucleotide biosynthesis protein B [Campylobacteraceae bacterium]
MSSVAIAFTGPSNSGKTTLIVKLSNYLKDRYKIAIVKHDPKDKGIFDVDGKDSDKFTKTGAEVIVTSPKRTTFFSNQEKSIDEIIELFSPFDILFVEGLKTLPLPRLGIFRGKLIESYFEHCLAIAIDESIDINDYKIPEHLEVLDLNNTEMVAEWILKNAKKIEVKR